MNEKEFKELEREEKQYQDSKSRDGIKPKRPYKRGGSQGRWWESISEEEEDLDSYRSNSNH